MTETVIDHAGPYARRIAANIAKLPPSRGQRTRRDEARRIALNIARGSHPVDIRPSNARNSRNAGMTLPARAFEIARRG
jgi:hypothetical protein